MKTITKYRPMVFSKIDAHATERPAQRRQLMVDASVVICYCIFGFWLTWDTGFAPWNWQFWVCFGPLFVAGEWLLYAFRPSPS